MQEKLQSLLKIFFATAQVPYIYHTKQKQNIKSGMKKFIHELLIFSVLLFDIGVHS